MAPPRVSAARIDQQLMQAREPAFWLNPELKLVWVNRAWEELTGHAAADAIGLVCRAHGPAAARTLVVHPSGERRWRRVEYHPFRVDGGDPVALLGLVRPPDEPAL